MLGLLKSLVQQAILEWLYLCHRWLEDATKQVEMAEDIVARV